MKKCVCEHGKSMHWENKNNKSCGQCDCPEYNLGFLFYFYESSMDEKEDSFYTYSIVLLNIF